MDNIDLEKENRFAMMRCVIAAMRMTGQHARTLVRRISKLFSRLSCIKVDVNENGKQYKRRMEEREKALVINHVEHTMVTSLGDDFLSRSSSYDSLTDTTLSVRASTLMNPSVTPTKQKSVPSYPTFPRISSDMSESSSSTSVVTVTPYDTDCVTSGTSPRSDATYTVVSACGSTRTPSDNGASESSSLASSPVSYYRSSTDLSVEDIEDEFWDL